MRRPLAIAVFLGSAAALPAAPMPKPPPPPPLSADLLVGTWSYSWGPVLVNAGGIGVKLSGRRP